MTRTSIASNEQLDGTTAVQEKPNRGMEKVSVGSNGKRAANTTVYFVTGLPRSGSTLLMNLLGQNPKHQTTASSGLIDMVVSIRNQWMHNVWFKAEGLDNVKPRVLSMMRGMVSGYHQEALADGKIVFDKNRGWLGYIELLEEILEAPIKMIVTVRDLKAIIASFEKIHRRSPLTKHADLGDAFFECQTIDGRARQILLAGSVVGLAVNRLRDALERGLGDRMIIVPYRGLTTDPRGAMNAIHEALGISAFSYNPDQVEQMTHEDDTVHGMELHTIRPNVKPYETEPWRGILPPRVCEWLDREYQYINSLANL